MADTNLLQAGICKKNVYMINKASSSNQKLGDNMYIFIITKTDALK